MNIQISEWINKSLQNRSWSQAELARRAHLSKATISDISSGKVEPSFEACVKIAKAFSVPALQVLRIAGLLPQTELGQQEFEQIVYIFENLSDEKRRMLIEFGRFLLSKNMTVL
jgi:DNA-binding XRE family transcriptional regulator